MSCDGRERKTFANTKRLALMAKEITGQRQVVYKEEGKETYAFCPEQSYEEWKGEYVMRV